MIQSSQHKRSLSPLQWAIYTVYLFITGYLKKYQLKKLEGASESAYLCQVKCLKHYYYYYYMTQQRKGKKKEEPLHGRGREK